MVVEISVNVVQETIPKTGRHSGTWLAMDEWIEDSEAPITLGEFQTLAWEAANEKARDLGWVKSCEDLRSRDPRRGRQRAEGQGSQHMNNDVADEIAIVVD